MELSFGLRRAYEDGSIDPKVGAGSHLLLGTKPVVIPAHPLSVEQFSGDLFTKYLWADINKVAITVALPTTNEDGERFYLEGVITPGYFRYHGGQFCEFRIKASGQTISVSLSLDPRYPSKAKLAADKPVLKLI